MDAAKVKFGVALTTWAEDHGKKKNVRTLLSTMHTVGAYRGSKIGTVERLEVPGPRWWRSTPRLG